jgi:hypothetical protein
MKVFKGDINAYINLFGSNGMRIDCLKKGEANSQENYDANDG